MRKNIIPLLLILIGIFASSRAFASIDSTLSKRFQKTLDSMLKVTHLEGISASVNIGSHGQWCGASGLSYAKHPMDTSMHLCIGSDTKLFISVMLLKLQELGILHLDDSLYKWLPKMANVDSTIKIRQLLNHTSGIADYLISLTAMVDSVSKNLGRHWTPEELVKNIQTPYFTKGTNWAYSNSDYLLAGMIVRNASKELLSKHLHKIILSPLQLNNTYLDAEDTLQGSVAHPWENGYDITNIIYNPRTAMSSYCWAAGGIYATAKDMANWYQALFRGKVINDSSMKQLLDFVPCNPLYGLSYGLGIATDTSNGRVILRHGGAIFGYLSRNLYDSIANTSIFVLVNQDGIDPTPVVAALHKVVMQYKSTGINNPTPSNLTITLAPNPAQNKILIQSSFNELSQYIVYNMGGQICLSGNIIPGGAHEIDISALPKSMYVVKISNNSGFGVNKFIKN